MLIAILIVFALGYLAITLEHQIRINKAASAMLMGVACWTLYVVNANQLLPLESIPQWYQQSVSEEGYHDIQKSFLVEHQLLRQTGEIAGILFFLIAAMTIVELIDAHEGFSLVTNRIRTTSQVRLLWVSCWLAFFLSSVLDNLTTTIVMVSLLRKVVPDREIRRLFAGMVVIAANAGGAWSVIGDVTTTMLWIKQKISPVLVMQELFLASCASLLLPLIVLSFRLKGKLLETRVGKDPVNLRIKFWHQATFLAIGLGGLLAVPLFKTYTHLPPFMGILLSLSVLWIISELISHTLDEATRSSTGILAVLKKVDMPSILFFLGILLAVGALGETGILRNLALWLDVHIGHHAWVAIIIGLVSAVVDNVPLVAAGIEMYSFRTDHPFWMMLAYCAGTGGSCLIIGSAAGVAAMGLEHIDFGWYLRKISPWALLGYFAGIAVYFAQQWIS